MDPPTPHYDIAAKFLGAGVVSVDRLPWLGEFDFTRQLEAKRDLIARLDHDWVIHADADEWLHSPRPGESLLGGIRRTAALGFDAINFEEFCSCRTPTAPRCRVTTRVRCVAYYFFAPQPVRLMRAWDRRQTVSNLAHGGHLLEGPDLRLSPEAFVLRHYIVLSQAHAIEKHRDRVFSRRDLAKGWFGNRLDLTEEKLRLPDPAALMELEAWTAVTVPTICSACHPLLGVEAVRTADSPSVLACIYTCEAHRPLLERSTTPSPAGPA